MLPPRRLRLFRHTGGRYGHPTRGNIGCEACLRAAGVATPMAHHDYTLVSLPGARCICCGARHDAP